MSENLDQSELAARLERIQPLHELAYAWYEVLIICKRVGAMIEQAAKEMLYAPNNDEETTNDTK